MLASTGYVLDALKKKKSKFLLSQHVRAQALLSGNERGRISERVAGHVK